MPDFRGPDAGGDSTGVVDRGLNAGGADAGGDDERANTAGANEGGERQSPYLGCACSAGCGCY
jgi:hypothetical protein